MLQADTRWGKQYQHIYAMEDNGEIRWVGWLKRSPVDLGKWEWYWATESNPTEWNGPVKTKRAAMEQLK